MPTWAAPPAFMRDFRRLSEDDRRAFRAARRQFASDLNAGEGFSPSLRIHKLSGNDGVWSVTFGADRRATFRYGEQQKDGLARIEWLAIRADTIKRSGSEAEAETGLAVGHAGGRATDHPLTGVGHRPGPQLSERAHRRHMRR